MLDLGIIIVNYNVRDFLRDCLQSVHDSQGEFRFEVCVVDNGSHDESAEMVAAEFPQVRLIRAENRGYAYGNNLGLREFGFRDPVEGIDIQAVPRFVLLLNPDTVLSPLALAGMLEFMEKHPQAGVAGPRLVREDGSLDKACHRGFPTPEVAAYRLSGLSRIFPNSERFGQYNLSYLPPDLVTEVDSVVGAFMVIRAEALADAGLLDEQYFMYAEDLDLCYRIKKLGWQVWYNADVTVLHYKGKSSSQRSTASNTHFYRTMWLFHDKHYKDQTFFLVNWTIYAAVSLMTGWALLRDRVRPAEKRGVASARPVQDAGGDS